VFCRIMFAMYASDADWASLARPFYTTAVFDDPTAPPAALANKVAYSQIGRCNCGVYQTREGPVQECGGNACCESVVSSTEITSNAICIMYLDAPIYMWGVQCIYATNVSRSPATLSRGQFVQHAVFRGGYVALRIPTAVCCWLLTCHRQDTNHVRPEPDEL
jgi:hypothetical protein